MSDETNPAPQGSGVSVTLTETIAAQPTAPAAAVAVNVNVTGAELAAVGGEVKKEAVAIVGAGEKYIDAVVTATKSFIAAHDVDLSAETEKIVTDAKAFAHDAAQKVATITSEAMSHVSVSGSLQTGENIVSTVGQDIRNAAVSSAQFVEEHSGKTLTAVEGEAKVVGSKAATEFHAISAEVESLKEEAEAEIAKLLATPPDPTAPVVIPPNTIRVLFTKTSWGIPSLFVRWALPRSRFAFGLSSHCLIDMGDYLYEALPIHGVRKSIRSVALASAEIVETVDFTVTDVQMAQAFLEAQLGKPYDYLGVIGLGIFPSRNWAQSNKWFCYEIAAAALKAAGLDVFSALPHITETPLLALKPTL